MTKATISIIMVIILKLEGMPDTIGLRLEVARLTGRRLRATTVSMHATPPCRIFPRKNTPYRAPVPFMMPMTWVCTENPANPQMKETRES